MLKVRTRFAPSPTGFIHIGGIRTALFSYLIAKKHKGAFILRIEDTDQERYVKGSIEVIYEALRDLGLNWDEGPDIGGPYGPYIQSERQKNYQLYAKQLIDEHKAYYCFCLDERLKSLKEKATLSKIPYKYDGHCLKLTKEVIEEKIANHEPYVIRFKMPDEGITVFKDQVYGEIKVNNEELEDLILIKSDGMPTYNFANIIDDHEMAITHIVRGNEYISSTPKYVLIYQALKWEVPEFIHLPIIKKEKDSDKKLSKRDHDATMAELKEKGYLNKAIINMLALTGWSSGSEREIFDLEELENHFEIKGIGKGNAIFDIDKLNWLNNHYLKLLTIDELYLFLYPYLNEAYDLSDKDENWLKELIITYQNQLSYGKEIISKTALFFKDKIKIDEEEALILKDKEVNNMLFLFKEELAKLNEWTIANIVLAIEKTKEKVKLTGKMLFMPIRIKVTGQSRGPELPKAIYLLGQEVVLKRLAE